MNFSYFLGAFLGLYLIVMGIALIVRKEMLHELIQDFTKGRVLIFFSGIISLLLGLFIVLSHPIWEVNWRVVITLLGYLFLIQGVIRIYFPDWVAESAKRFSNTHLTLIIGSLLTLIGLFLTYHGLWK